MCQPASLFRAVSLLLAVVGLLLSSGCGDKGQSPESVAPPAQPSAEAPKPAAEAPAEPKAAEKPAAEPTEKVEDPTFELKAESAGPYKPGALGSFQVSLTPRGEYHINQDYPMEITVTAKDGLTLPKSRLAKADAAEFAESRARFDVPFTAAAAGSHKVECNVKFAVCTPETCVPDERTLALAVAVE